jgi:hypothetical protein
MRRRQVAAIGLAALVAGVTGCSSSTTKNTASGSAGGQPSGAPPSGGQGAGGGGSTTPVTGTGAYTLSGGTATKSGVTITASATDQSGVLVNNSGKLTMTGVSVVTSGKSSSSDNSSFYGLNAGVLAFTGSSITQTGGSVSTTGAGANAVFAYGSGSSVTISGTKITATGQYAHGIMTSGGGSITATNLTVGTAGGSSAAVATDRGGGTISVTGGTYTTSGGNSPGLYSTGTLVASNATFNATGAEAAVVEGANSVKVVNCTLTGAKNRGVMIYQSFSGDAQGSTGTYTGSGGSLTATAGPLFFVTNATGVINLTGVRLSVTSGVLLDASANNWGTSGSNGGNAMVNANGQALTGSVTVDKISTATLKLTNASTFTGAIDTAGTAKSVTLGLDGTSTWMVTANSHVTTLTGAVLSGSTVTNITGNGHTVYYSKSANSSLGGKTYALTGGGTLTPA